MAKLRVGLLFGGRSVEHEVSIASATSILQALDPDRYEVSLLAVDQAGRWHLSAGTSLIRASSIEAPEVLLPAAPGSGTLLPVKADGSLSEDGLALDVIFPIMHGRGGEDGALQGLMELADIAYVGSGVLSSAIQMDKDIAKRLLAAAGLPVLPWVVLRAHALVGAGMRAAVDGVKKELGFPVFVKPANSGSSVGIAKAADSDELALALRDAARYDDKIIVERGVDAREIEVAVLGNESPEASVPGEIRPTHEFYDYEAKYHDSTTDLVIPAELSDEESQHLRDLATEAYLALEAEGMARVDFLVERESGRPYLNELNSLPGFTDVSMYPRLWEATGLPYAELLDRLIELAMDRHRRRSMLETRYRRPGR
ncbi:MAG: D-alanine--D-alanine ligase [Deltaproteobacteria bacterium]|nr:D-alanine--D-alanine ligase [Deltaproteobacteria bacterium]